MRVFSSDRLVTRRNGALAGLAFLACALGCMSFQHSEIHPEGVGMMHPVAGAKPTVQNGEVTLAAKRATQVFYPVPHTSNPNLTLHGDDSDNFEIVEQKPTFFRVRNTSLFSRTVRWSARGLCVMAEATPQAPVPVAAEKAPDLPPPLPAPKGDALPERPIPIYPVGKEARRGTDGPR